MEQAWLDSLSEDWISQPRSAGSPAPSLPSLSNSTSESTSARATSSRIPKYNPEKQSWTTTNESTPLSERSINDINIPSSQHGLRPSKLRTEISNSQRGRRLSRTLSASTAQSTQCHTVQHKSLSVSPKKSSHQTPEWKRRLLHGDVAYGEQRDLFSPAGLETIFRPPPPQTNSSAKFHNHDFGESSVMPSSPPPYHIQPRFDRENEASQDEETGPESREREPRVMKYKLVDEESAEFSGNDLSQGSSFKPIRPQIHRMDQNDSDQPSTIQASQAGRAISGQSDIRNEELSPIYISRHNGGGGNIDFVAADLSASGLQQRLEELDIDDQLEEAEDLEASRSQPADTTTDTDDYARDGRFVNLRRGGRSQEGSFMKRALSPSSLPAIDESALMTEESMQASTPKQLPNIRKTRPSNEFDKPQIAPNSFAIPPTPHPSPAKGYENGVKPGSGSPLKLFGTYDTFTNQKLLRRLSQFEGSANKEDEELPSNTAKPTGPGINEAFVAASSPYKGSQSMPEHQGTSRKYNSFGQGELDSFQFSEEMSYDSNGINSQNEDTENQSLPVLDPKLQKSFKFQLEPSPSLEGIITRRSSKHTNTMSTTRKTVTTHKSARPGTGSSDASAAWQVSQMVEDLETPRKHNGDSEGKRLPRSPLKDPTPKRRRTLHKTELSQTMSSDESAHLDSLKDTHQQMQSVIGKKRKDARHEDDQQAANPKVLAMRQIARPRTPTPSQRSSIQREQAPSAEEEPDSIQRAKLLQDKKIAKIQAELDFANSRPPVPLGANQHMYDDSRKGSVTTQDFLDEAKKIMAGIRGKARPRSGLTSVEESESENDKNMPGGGDMGMGQHDEFEDSYQESTQEPFSRPPSREGPPVTRMPVKQQDPELLDHLRKYQEMSDMDVIIASSTRSIAMAKDAAINEREMNRIAEETISKASSRFLTEDNSIESEPPNIRISENPDLQRKRKHSTSTVGSASDDHHNSDFPSQGSNASSNQSVPTGSSRGSDSRRVIAPHTVSHLIPEQVAGMVFDRERNIWIKRKSVSGENHRGNYLPSDETEDDPFGDIPDLSVDETQELLRVKAVAAKRKEEARMAQESSRQAYNNDEEQQAHRDSKDIPTPSQVSDVVPPSEPIACLSSNGTARETNARLTSWKDDNAPVTKSIQTAHHSLRSIKTKTSVQKEVIEEVEKEISIHEDRVDPSTPRRRRNVTITFSSPLTEEIQPPVYEDEESIDQEDDVANRSCSEAFNRSSNDSIIIRKRSNKNRIGLRSALRTASRRVSIGGHQFSTRPVSRIDERDEESGSKSNEERHARSVSVVVSTPILSRRESSVVLATPRPLHEIGTLELSPLSDFTMHQAEESFNLEVSYIERGQRYTLGSGGKTTLSHTIKELVEKLTEVEPYEPFWEHMKQMDLKNRKLTSLHKLDEFCERLEELDVSNNQISQLNGAPSTIRNLRITHNYLSDLTAWGHLSNLQYIDVSNNEIESLSAFTSLVHLRGLRADNNKITSLHGIGNLDGLLSLRLRGNQIETINFGGTSLHRLSDLDLKDNRIRGVQNLQQLNSLSALNLDNNDLDSFSSDGHDPMWTLKHLKLSGNKLNSIDVSQFPDLRLLYLDRNRLGTVTGLLKAKHLDSLSMREQQNGVAIDQSFLSEAFEVRKLFLSGNLLTSFQPRVHFLNLQYLELANCGLETLPPDFGQMVLNTRVLNLNFNALRDIQPLLGIVRLKRLQLAGNRLTRLRLTTTVLSQFPTLSSVDLRNNPLTIGFYPPVIERSMVVHEAKEADAVNADPYILGDANVERDEKYASCLDMDTRMLRRVFDILIVQSCPRLKILDGHGVNKAIAELRDQVWDKLVEDGVVNAPLVAVGEAVVQNSNDGKKEALSEESSEKQDAVEVVPEAEREDPVP